MWKRSVRAPCVYVAVRNYFINFIDYFTHVYDTLLTINLIH